MERSQSKFYTQDILYVFQNIKEVSSRAALVQATGLGEGSIRSILLILKEKGLIEASKKGHALTKKGEVWHNKLESALNIFECPVKDYDLAFHIKPPITEKQSYELRDLAVKWGSKGALIFYYNGKDLLLPPSDCVDYSINFEPLKENLNNGDYLVLLWGAPKEDLITGGLAIAGEISDTLKEFLVTLN